MASHESGNPVREFDLVVVGGGKAGKTLAMAAGHRGRSVALVERGQIGGACINVACIPTKALVASAEAAHLGHHSQDLGIALGADPQPFPGAIARKSAVVAGLVAKHWDLFEQTPNLELLIGQGRMRTEGERAVVDVTGDDGRTDTVTAPAIVINTGSRPVVPDVPGLDTVPFLTSTDALSLESAPDRLIVIGGGYIAVELAQAFARLGSDVTMLIREDQFLPREDPSIADALAALLTGEGIELRFGVAVSEVVAGSGEPAVEVRLDGGERISGSHLLVATGRTPETADLGLPDVGVDVDERGGIVVGADLQTSVPGIYAAGDCTGGLQFTHVSWDDFRVLDCVLFGDGNRSTTDRLVPYTLFTSPELGRVGLTEEQARGQGYDVLIAEIPAGVIPRAVTTAHTEGLLRAVIDAKTDRILGCSLLCHGAGEIMAVVQLAMVADQPYQVLRDMIWTHPTMAEALNLLFAAVRT